MNPLVVPLIGVPLAIMLLLLGAIFLVWFTQGFKTEFIGPSIVLLALIGGLIFIARRFCSRNGSYVSFPGSESVDIELKRKLTNGFLALTYIMVGAGLMALVELESFRYWIGGICLLFSFGYFYSSFFEFKNASRFPHMGEARVSGTQLESLRLHAQRHKKATRFVIVVYTLLAIAGVVTYFFFKGGVYLALFDLVGFLILLCSACTWYVVHERHLTAHVQPISD
jgi:hypothetical protein